MAPRTSDQRGPASSAIAPTIGAPMGVLPTNAVDHSAVTRPRNAGAAASCAVLLPLVKKVTLVAPTSVSSTTSIQKAGTSAAARVARPKPAAAATRAGMPVEARFGGSEAAEYCTDPERAEQPALCGRAAVEGVTCDEWERDFELIGERADQRHHQERCEDLRPQPRITKAVAQPPTRGRPWGRLGAAGWRRATRGPGGPLRSSRR